MTIPQNGFTKTWWVKLRKLGKNRKLHLLTWKITNQNTKVTQWTTAFFLGLGRCLRGMLGIGSLGGWVLVSLVEGWCSSKSVSSPVVPYPCCGWLFMGGLVTVGSLGTLGWWCRWKKAGVVRYLEPLRFLSRGGCAWLVGGYCCPSRVPTSSAGVVQRYMNVEEQLTLYICSIFR